MWFCLKIVIALFLLAGNAHAAPKAELWDRWTEHDPQSRETIDHRAWGAFIDHYRVGDKSGVALIRYGDVTDDDRERLESYIQRLAALPISDHSRDVQRAYWLNLYNALTVNLILEHYPVDSIRDINISPGWFTRGPWGAEVVQVEGQSLTLDDIEHRILRPIWQDPRIHYGVNCASIGCPDLQSEPFTAENAYRLLDQGASAYVNHPRGAAFSGDRLTVSSIYDWFQEDFGGSQAGVLKHLRRYAEPELAEQLKGRSGYDDHAYDWSLNEPTGD